MSPDDPRPPRPAARVHVEAVRIAEVREHLDSILATDFTAGEAEELRGRHVQTVAAFLALKRAYLSVARLAGVSEASSLRDVELTHGESGAPVVRRAPALRGRAAVSLAHTREHAYGLVALEEQDDG